MLLDSLMEEMQLDFNQPLLSVRKFSSTVPATERESKRRTDVMKIPPLPHYKSGPVRNPGTVPFVWEQSPGRPKDEKKSQNKCLERPPVAPKLPPGRILNVNQQGSDSRFEGTGAGQSQTKSPLSSSQDIPHSEKYVDKEENLDGVIEDAGSSSEDGTDALVDALDTLSRSESFFLNCSVSGVSGLDGPDLKTFGTFSTDPQTRDFMMGRFLPAAKAMASENPQHTARKQLVRNEPVPREFPKHIQKVVTLDKRRSLHPHWQDSIQHNAHGLGMEESEDEDDDDYGHDNSSLKVCGLLPRLCLQNSFCPLNPMPGLRKHAHAPVLFARSTKRNPYTPSQGETEIKAHAPVSFTRSTKRNPYAPSQGETEIKPNRITAHERQPMNGFHAPRMQEKRSVRTSDTNQICNAGKLEGSSVYKCLQGNGISPYHNGLYQSATKEEKGTLGISERSNSFEESGSGSSANGGTNFHDLLAKEKIEWESSRASPVVEKTVYIDSLNVVKSQNSKSSSSDMEGLTDYGKDETEVSVNDKENVDTPSVHSSLRDIKHLDVDEKAKVRPGSSESIDSCYLSISDIHDMQMDVLDSYEHSQEQMKASISLPSPKLAEHRKVDNKNSLDDCSDKLQGLNVLDNGPIIPLDKNVADGRKIDLESEILGKSTEQGDLDGRNLLPPLPPPLPKSPSESWLQRTLPNVSSRNSRSSAGLRACPGLHSTMNSPDSRLETIVRTSNVQHGHLLFSEELLTPIPEA